MHTFISSRLDFCKAFLFGSPKKAMRRLQLVQNAAARVSKSRRWFSINFRMNFKIFGVGKPAFLISRFHMVPIIKLETLDLILLVKSKWLSKVPLVGHLFHILDTRFLCPILVRFVYISGTFGCNNDDINPLIIYVLYVF